MLFNIDDREYDKDDCEPLKIAKWIVNCPVLVTAISLGFALLSTISMFHLYSINVNHRGLFGECSVWKVCVC